MGRIAPHRGLAGPWEVERDKNSSRNPLAKQRLLQVSVGYGETDARPGFHLQNRERSGSAETLINELQST